MSLCPCQLQSTWRLSWAYSTCWLWLYLAGVPRSGISNLLESPLHLQLHTLPYQRLPSGLLTRLCIASPPRPLKHGWKPPWPCNSCIKHMSKISITCMKAKSAVSWSWALLDHGCNTLSTWIAHHRETLLQAALCRQGAPHLSSQSSLSKRVKTFTPLGLWSVWPGQFLKRQHFNHPNAKYFAVVFFSFFWWYMRFELWASLLVGRHSTTWATLPALFCVGDFQDKASQTICLGLALNHDPLVSAPLVDSR
jgi:hypothetical protein